MYTEKRGNLEILWKDVEYAKLLGPSLEQEIAKSDTFSRAPLSNEGRGPSEFIQQSPQEIFRIRPYLRGGMIQYLSRDLFWGPNKRPFHELRISLHAYQNGVPTAEPIAGVVKKGLGGFYRGYWVSREISHAQNLFKALLAHPNAKEKKEILQITASATRKMHDTGIFHADLHLGNIVIQKNGDSFKAYLIDFDRAEVRNPLSNKDRMNNLIRFYRSAYKYPKIQSELSKEDWGFFFESYGLDPSAIKNLLKEGNRSVKRHSLSGWLQRRLLGRGKT
jgi:tRNA A-37 threonylcarbamoyl transferase component Bud32